jgi:hypothetical protein
VNIFASFELIKLIKFKTMKLPFNTQQFLDVFKAYNQSVWPLQLVFILLAVFAVFVVIWKPISSGKIIPVILALLWIWMGGVYHLLFFSAINEVAKIFGILFIMQGLLFLRYALTGAQTFQFRKGTYGTAAGILIIYALVIYPLTGYYTGHVYPYSPTFGLPCPTTIFTFGILILSKERLPFYMLIIPFIWTIIGFSAVLKLGMYEDTGLILSALLLCILNIIRYKKMTTFTGISLAKQ